MDEVVSVRRLVPRRVVEQDPQANPWCEFFVARFDLGRE